MRGRRKPIELHKIEGTYRPSEHAGKGLKSEVIEATQQPPKRMHAEAAKIWRAILPIVQRGQVYDTDLMAFEMLCNSFADYLYCSKVIVEEGYKTTRISTEGNEITQRHYLSADKKQAHDMIQSMLAKFGLTPADRAKVYMAVEAEEADELDGLV